MKEKVMANVKTNLSAADAALLVRDCEAEAADARNIALNLAAGGSGEVESLCGLGHDYTPYSDDVEDNILNRLASSAIDDSWNTGDAKVMYEIRVEEIFGRVSERALEFFKQELIDEGLAA
jgi:hypothetical protein